MHQSIPIPQADKTCSHPGTNRGERSRNIQNIKTDCMYALNNSSECVFGESCLDEGDQGIYNFPVMHNPEGLAEHTGDVAY